MIRLKAISVILLIPILGGYLAAQQPSPSLADIAKASRAKKGASAKVVLNEETIEARKGPSPMLRLMAMTTRMRF
jgi:hypothetical protein